MNERLKECEIVSVRECESERVTFEHRHENKSSSACLERVNQRVLEVFLFFTVFNGTTTSLFGDNKDFIALMMTMPNMVEIYLDTCKVNLMA